MDLFCTKCGEYEDENAFPKAPANKRRNGKGSWCKECVRKSRLKEKFVPLPPIDLENAVHSAYEAQRWRTANPSEPKCAVCGRTEAEERSIRKKSLSVDHCHQTGYIRDYLCGDHNMGLGFFKDNIQHLESAIAYLKLHADRSRARGITAGNRE